MLILMRKKGQFITCISGETHIQITVSKIVENQVYLGIDAPKSVNIVRNELITGNFKSRDEIDTVTLCGLCNVLLSDNEDECPHCNTLTLTYYK